MNDTNTDVRNDVTESVRLDIQLPLCFSTPTPHLA